MNDQLQKFARDTLKTKLKVLPEAWQMTFKRMYSHTNLTLPIDEVVDKMPDTQLDWAMTQVENSYNKLQKQKVEENK